MLENDWHIVDRREFFGSGAVAKFSLTLKLAPEFAYLEYDSTRGALGKSYIGSHDTSPWTKISSYKVMPTLG